MKKFTPIFLASLTLIASINVLLPMNAMPSQCDDIKVVWANGSGADINGTDNNYLDFKNAVQHELMKTSASFSFYELGTSAHGGYQYPAASVGVRSLDETWRTIQAKIGAGESYEYGESALEGANEMSAYVREIVKMCPETKFVLGGLSQGGQVVSRAIQDIDPDNVIYAATFGDPKLYLPEGKYGKNSSACTNIYYENYSEYRAYVPDCEAYEGILKARVPYQPAGYSGKLGAWCSYHDVMCSSHINLLDLWEDSLAPHGSYGKSYFAYDLYGDAAQIIRKKVSTYIKGKYGKTTTSNVVYVVDRSKYASEFSPLLEDVLGAMTRDAMQNGAEVAVYFVEGDAAHPTLQIKCGFPGSSVIACDETTINEAIFERIDSYDFDDISASYPGWSMETDLLYKAMSSVEWKPRADKTMVLLTNAGFRAGAHSVNDLINLSMSIDPVHVYSYSPDELISEYIPLTQATNGGSFTLTDAGEISFGKIPEEEEEEIHVRSGWGEPEDIEDIAATIGNIETEMLADGSLEVTYNTKNAKAVAVILNDAFLGFATPDGVTLTGVKYSVENTLVLRAFSEEGYAGEDGETKIDIYEGEAEPTDVDDRFNNIKAPNTGVVVWSKEMKN